MGLKVAYMVKYIPEKVNMSFSTIFKDKTFRRIPFHSREKPVGRSKSRGYT